MGVVAAVRALDVATEANQEPIETAKKAEAELKHVMHIVIHSLSQIWGSVQKHDLTLR